MTEADGPSVTFREAMAPTVSVLTDLSTTAIEASARHGNLPSADSMAMRDLEVDEKTYGGRSSWDRPLADTQSLGAMTLVAAADYGHSYAELFSGSRTPVYGHLVVARAALEACVISAWLSDCEIDPTERVRRGLSELIYSAWEVHRLKVPEFGDTEVSVRRWEEVARLFNWEVKPDRRAPVVDGTKRPLIPNGISRLLLDDREARLGRVQWSYLSAVVHVTWYGLSPGIIDPPQESAALGPSLAGVGTESRSVDAQSLCLIRALRRAGTIRMIYMGWIDEEWRRACELAERHERELLGRRSVSKS